VASIDNPADTGGRLIAARKVTGTSVYNATGEKLGSVYDVMLDKMSGRADYAILSFGGFLGIGDRYHPLPWDQLTYDTQLGGYVLDLDRSRLEGAPTYQEDELGHWNDSSGSAVDDYYGTPGIGDAGMGPAGAVR